MRSTLFYISLLLFPFNQCVAQNAAIFDRLQDNEYNFPTKSIDSILRPLNKSAFFYGETHTRNFEPQFKYDLITYLHSHYHVLDIFMEIGHSAATIFNEYLATGDSNLIALNILYTSPHYMKMWTKLYSYNQHLPADKKLRIHGIDFESPKTFYKALLFLVQDGKAIPISLSDIAGKITSWSVMNSKELNDIHAQNQKAIRKIFDTHKADVANLYGSNFATVNNIIHNDDFAMTDKNRELKMFNNLQDEIRENKVGMFAGFFGGDHVNYTNRTALPVKLRSLPGFKNRVSTIRMICFNAIDNWSQEKFECIGTYEFEECKRLRQAYMKDDYRAVLVSDELVKEKLLKGSADNYLFAEDN